MAKSKFLIFAALLVLVVQISTAYEDDDLDPMESTVYEKVSSADKYQYDSPEDTSSHTTRTESRPKSKHSSSYYSSGSGSSKTRAHHGSGSSEYSASRKETREGEVGREGQVRAESRNTEVRVEVPRGESRSRLESRGESRLESRGGESRLESRGGESRLESRGGESRLESRSERLETRRGEDRSETRRDDRIEPRREERLEPRRDERVESRRDERVEPRRDERIELRAEGRLSEQRESQRLEPRGESQRVEVRGESPVRLESREDMTVDIPPAMKPSSSPVLVVAESQQQSQIVQLLPRVSLKHDGGQRECKKCGGYSLGVTGDCCKSCAKLGYNKGCWCRSCDCLCYDA